MVSFCLAAAAAALSLATTATAATLAINTPTSLIVCQPSLISWSGGTAPYYVTILPGGEPSATALETLESGSDATSVSWTVDIVAGTNLTFALKDSTGALAYSAAVVTAAGTSTTCIGTDSTAAASSGSATTSATSGSTSKVSSSSGSSTKASSSSGSSAASASASSSSIESSGACKNLVAAGVAGLAAALSVLLA